MVAGEPPSRQRFRTAAAKARLAARAVRRRGARVQTSGRVFSEWLSRSRADLALLTTEFATGPYPYAGIPWFSTAFGRDAIVTAMQLLWLDPSLARGVLRFLAAHQATETSRFTDAAPGKIMHETRKGEMARLRELPFGKYYGGVDTTPLFVMLAGAYAARTGDLALIDELWPALLAAMQWIEGDGDSDRDGFVDYARGEDTGLANQGWKDSEDSVFDASRARRRGPDRAGRGAGLRVRGVQGHGRYGHAAGRARGCLRRLAGQGGAVAAGGRGAFLGRGVGQLRPGARRPGSALPSARLQPGPPPVYRPADSGAGRTGRGTAAEHGVQYRLGPAHPGPRRAALQPDVLSQRLGLAARYRPVRGRHRPLRRAGRGGRALERHVRDRGQVRHAATRAVLWLPATARGAADRLSGRLPAAGLGLGLGLHDAAGLPGAHHRRLARRDPCRSPAPAGRHRPAHHPPAGRG